MQILIKFSIKLHVTSLTLTPSFHKSENKEISEVHCDKRSPKDETTFPPRNICLSSLCRFDWNQVRLLIDQRCQEKPFLVTKQAEFQAAPAYK